MDDLLLASVFSPEETIKGFEQWDLGDRWWQTLYSIPANQNPLSFDDESDPNGAAGSSNKASETRIGNIQLLGGSNTSSTAERTITVLGGSVFFFPILNAALPDPYVDEDGNLAGGIGGTDPEGDPITEEGVRQDLANLLGDTDLIEELNASIDGVAIPGLFDYRQVSQDGPFFIELPDDNLYGPEIPAGSFGGVLADGYWAGIGNLSPEDHVITFGAALEFDSENEGPDFVIDITYNISFDLNEIVGTNRKDADAVRGTEGWDEIQGLNGKDYIVGLEGNDALYGGNGPDTLIGTNPDASELNPGEGEIDILYGGRGPDTHVLGDAKNAYYVGQERRDYALIRGFRNEDAIQLNGDLSYELDNTVKLGTEPGTGIFLKETDELIGFVENVTNLSLTSNDFVLV